MSSSGGKVAIEDLEIEHLPNVDLYVLNTHIMFMTTSVPTSPTTAIFNILTTSAILPIY